MKKILFFGLLLFLLVSCSMKEEKRLSDLQTDKRLSDLQTDKRLSDLQTDVCNSAHDEGSCNTKLLEIGIVKKEDCCTVLKKCC